MATTLRQVITFPITVEVQKLGIVPTILRQIADEYEKWMQEDPPTHREKTLLGTTFNIKDVGDVAIGAEAQVLDGVVKTGTELGGEKLP